MYFILKAQLYYSKIREYLFTKSLSQFYVVILSSYILKQKYLELVVVFKFFRHLQEFIYL